jgi:hypothetical protein
MAIAAALTRQIFKNFLRDVSDNSASYALRGAKSDLCGAHRVLRGETILSQPQLACQAKISPSDRGLGMASAPGAHAVVRALGFKGSTTFEAFPLNKFRGCGLFVRTVSSFINNIPGLLVALFAAVFAVVSSNQKCCTT